MNTAQRTEISRTLDKDLSDTRLLSKSTAVNWVHVIAIAPGLAMLKYRPQFLQYAPYVAGFVAAFHSYEIWDKSKKNK